MEVLLYELKSEENLEEFARICEDLKIKLIIIQRKSCSIDYEKFKKLNVEIYKSLDEYLENNHHKKFLIFETYGNKFINEVNLKEFDVFVFGSEDYGIPLNEIEKFKNKEIVKIPTKVPGSYNVVSSFIIALTFFFFEAFK